MVGDLRKPGCVPRTSTFFARTFLSKKDSPFHFFIQQKFLLSLLLTIFFTDSRSLGAFLEKAGEKAIKQTTSMPFLSIEVSFLQKRHEHPTSKFFPKPLLPSEKNAGCSITHFCGIFRMGSRPAPQALFRPGASWREASASFRRRWEVITKRSGLSP